MINAPKSWNNPDRHYLDAIRSNWYRNILTLQDELNFSTHTFFRAKGLHTLFLPVTTGSISSPMGLGSDSIPVKVRLGGIDTYLADSMQFLLEYGCRFFEKGCYYLMPSFRGEDADERHLCQFYHSEAEIIGCLQDVQALVEDYIRYLSESLLMHCEQSILDIAGTTTHIQDVLKKNSFPQIEYDEAINLLRKQDNCITVDKNGFEYITPIGERQLIREFGGVVWLVLMDKRIVPFYQAQSEDSKHALCADLLLGTGEVVGAGERHQNGDSVINALSEHNVLQNEYQWYINMKDHFPLQTSGFGMGTERYLLWLLKHNDIRDCQVVPRFNHVRFSL